MWVTKLRHVLSRTEHAVSMPYRCLKVPLTFDESVVDKNEIPIEPLELRLKLTALLWHFHMKQHVLVLVTSAQSSLILRFCRKRI